MSEQTRRQMIQATAAFAISSQTSRILGANDKVNIAVVGIGGRGTNHLQEYTQLDCHVAAVCDVNQAAQERAVALVEKVKGHKPKVYSDLRQLLDDKEVNAVSLATPNHWHALQTIWACQAGKDVYVEKPCCHNIFEGKKMTEAARKYNRMVQAGTQSRSIPHKMEAIQLLHDGFIGKIYMAKALCYKRRKTIGRKPDLDSPPAGVNWDMFLGPAPLRKFNENRFKYNWHWFWDTGNGDIGNQGVHEMDVALWGMDKKVFPKTVTCTGGKFVYDDDQETPNTQLATFDYGDAQMMFEVRGMPTADEGPLKVRGSNVVGNLFYGSEGMLAVDGSGYWVHKGEKLELVKEGKSVRGDTGRHMQNFLDAVKSRKREDLRAEVAINTVASDYCHLANIAYRTGRKLTWDFNKEQFAGDSEANALMTRPYRKPYVVPERV